MGGKSPPYNLKAELRNGRPEVAGRFEITLYCPTFCEVNLMSHAIIRAGGKQFLVEEGQTIRVPSLEAEAGSSVELETLLSSGAEGKNISATVVDHGRDQKIVVFKKKRRKQYKRTRGHRQNYTTLKIESIG